MSTDKYGSARWANENDLRAEGISAIGVPSVREFASLKEMRAYYTSKDPGLGAFLLSRLVSPSELLAGARSEYVASTSGLLAGMANWFSGAQKSGRSGDLIGWLGDGHITTIAPTRSGKGVGLVIPNLLNYPGSVLVVDPKGENYAVTSRCRRDAMGQEVICLDPFGICEEETHFINPLDGLVNPRRKPETYLDDNPALIDEISVIVDAMIVRGKDEKDPHWNDKARTLLKGLTLAVVCGFGPKMGRHLGEVRNLLLQPRNRLTRMFDEWSFEENVAGGALSRAALEIQSMAEQELSSVISTAARHTEFLDSAQALRSIGFNQQGGSMRYDMRNLKAEGCVSIYMIVPPHHLTKYSRLIRLWVTAAASAMTRTIGRPADGYPVLFLLDEIAQLGRMEPLIQAVSLLAGYGMSMWMVWQDLAQMKALYEGEWSSFLANSKIQQYFGVNDYETAKYVSDMLGEATIDVSSVSESRSTSRNTKEFIGSNVGGGSANTFSEISRSLMKPDEIRRLNREIMLTFVQGCPPIVSKRLAYFRDPEFEGRFDANPGMAGHGVGAAIKSAGR
ncbi:MAG: type IV secretory system conjugative DNA transfer family protein [Synergistaceae bacterium]|nr:type IV secretory system conjugative DNA transfer family protein [Synergistaceae bacterium]